MLTPLQAACLTSIVDHLDRGRSPTMADLALDLGCLKGTAQRLLGELEVRGFIRRAARVGRHRRIEVVRRPAVSVYRWDDAAKALRPFKMATARSGGAGRCGGATKD